MAIISQNGIKSGFFVISGRISGKSRRAGRVFIQNKADFQNAEMNVTLYSKKDYDSEPRRRLQKNKPKQACPEQRRMEPISKSHKKKACQELFAALGGWKD